MQQIWQMTNVSQMSWVEQNGDFLHFRNKKKIGDKMEVMLNSQLLSNYYVISEDFCEPKLL